MPPARWPVDAAGRAKVQAKFDPIYGDRRQEIVFIGMLGMMNRARITAMLEKCLIPAGNDEAFDPSAFAHLPDPFPQWERASAA